MIKGAQKQMIVLRTGDSHYFDEAYFVLRRELHANRCSKDMLREANRILEENALSDTGERGNGRPKAGRRRLMSLLWFLLGLALGAGSALALCLLLL